MPHVDEGGFVLDYFTPAGHVADRDRPRGRPGRRDPARERRRCDTFSRRLGTGLGGDLGQSYHGDFFVRLKADHARSTDDVMSAVLADRSSRQVPGVRDRARAADGGPDRRPDLGPAADRDQALRRRSRRRSTGRPRRSRKPIGKIDGVVEVKSGVQARRRRARCAARSGARRCRGPDARRRRRKLCTTALSGTVATPAAAGDQGARRPRAAAGRAERCTDAAARRPADARARRASVPAAPRGDLVTR